MTDALPDVSFLENEAGKEDVDVLAQIAQKCNQLVEARKDIAFIEGQLQAAQAAEVELSSEAIPQLLLHQGLMSITLETGEKITIKEVLYATVPKAMENKITVLNWLIKSKGGYLIKRGVMIEEPEKWILDLLEDKDVPHEESRSVNTNSFKAFLRGKLGLKKGSLQEIELSEIPKEANVFIRKETKIEN